MTTMLDKAALAICNQIRDYHGLGSVKTLDVVENPDVFRRQIRAALQAIRVPSIPVASAGQWDWLRNVMGFTSPTPPVRDCVEANVKASQNFTAMIDAILSESANP